MNDQPKKICFLADRHGLYDDRIYWKEALSLQKNGFEIHYIFVADRTVDGITGEGIRYYSIGKKKYFNSRILNRFLRIILNEDVHETMFRKALEIKADVYHIHDLKVNRIGSKLKHLSHRPKIIYDVHEPYPENIVDYFTGPSVLKPLNKIYAGYIRKWERKCAADYDLIITTEENLQLRFKNYFPEKPVGVIYNFTNLPVYENEIEKHEKKYDAIYTGGITERRGALKILEAIRILVKDHPKFRMLFIGTWFPDRLRELMTNLCRQYELENNVVMRDIVPYREIAGYYRQSKIGLGIFLPIPTHRIILQIKIFEYLNFGLPLVGSNFGHIQKIIEKHRCGIPVDPEDPAEIAAALKQLLEDQEMYAWMSRNGREAARQNYRWEIMEVKLIELYRKLFD